MNRQIREVEQIMDRVQQDLRESNRQFTRELIEIMRPVKLDEFPNPYDLETQLLELLADGTDPEPPHETNVQPVRQASGAGEIEKPASAESQRPADEGARPMFPVREINPRSESL